MKYQILHSRDSLDDLLEVIAKDLCKSKKEFKRIANHEANCCYDERIGIFEGLIVGRDLINLEEMDFRKLCKVFSDRFGGLLEIYEADHLYNERHVEDPKVYFAIYGC